MVESNGKDHRSEVEKLNDYLREKDSHLTPDEKYFANSDLANLDWRDSPSWKTWLKKLMSRKKQSKK